MKTKQTRLTKQKKAIASLLDRCMTHYTAEEIFERVRLKIKNISLATVYRNLEQMAEQRLIDVVYVAGQPKWYEKKKTGSHGHLYCRQCGDLQDVVDCQVCQIRYKCSNENNFEAEEIDFVVLGVCEKCQESSK